MTSLATDHAPDPIHADRCAAGSNASTRTPLTRRSRRIRSGRTATGVVVGAVLALVGCVHPAPPPSLTYPLVDADTTLVEIHDRAAVMANVTGKGSVTLSNPKRGDISLESVFVFRPPGDARVRAWKFNQAVFDLTVTADGAWLYSPRDKDAANAAASGKALGDSVRQWVALLFGDLRTPDTATRLDGNRLLLTRPGAAGGTLLTTIDRPTQTVRSQRLVDARGVERFRLSFDHYRVLSNQPWPTRITAVSPTGTIVVHTDSLSVNDAPDTAFTPSPRATRLP